ISVGSRFRLEDCADDVAALAQVLGIGRFIAVGYSMGGMVAQLLYRRHPSLLSGLVLCATARSVLGSPAEKLVALALPTAAAAIRWNPFLPPLSAEPFGMALDGPRRGPGPARAGPGPAEADHPGHRHPGRPGRLRVPLTQLDRPGGCPRRGGGHGPGSHRPGQPPAAAGPGDSRRLGPRGGRRP